MMMPGVLTIGFPLVIAFLPLAFGMDNLMVAEMLGGYMAGVTVSGVLWAIFQNNAGGAWDNAKKSFEAGVMVDGEMTFKGSEAHKAAVTGDTVGDPFKDTSGPSMNILIKLTCLIGLVIAPIIGNGHSEGPHGAGAGADCCVTKTECSTDAHACKKDVATCHGEKSCDKKASCDNKSECTKGACDMSKCSEMSKEECAAMCDEKGYSPEDKAKCMAMYDENGKFIGDKEFCCEGKMKTGKCDATCEH